jgi:hypothetical protein
MLPVLRGLLNCSVGCLRSLIMALSGCVAYEVVDVQCNVVLHDFRGCWMVAPQFT